MKNTKNSSIGIELVRLLASEGERRGARIPKIRGMKFPIVMRQGVR